MIPGPAQLVKDLALPQLQHKSEVQLGLDSRPGSFHIPWVWPKKKKKVSYVENKESITKSENKVFRRYKLKRRNTPLRHKTQ